MGWTTFHETRTAKQYFIDSFRNEKNVELVDIAVVGFNVAYMAIKDIEKGYIYCAVYLLHRAPKSYHNFGYKPMDEFCGPYQLGCPQRIINKLTPLDEIKRLDPEISDNSIEYASNWRQRVLDEAINKKERNKKLKGILKTKEPILFTSGANFQYFTKVGNKLFAIEGLGTELERRFQVRISGWKNIEFENI